MNMRDQGGEQARAVAEADTFDYIVVGAGTAGCVIARRLSERPNIRVLVIEAGDVDRNLWVRIPLGIGKLLTERKHLWVAPTEPEPGLHGTSMTLLGGRIWGGSSSVNGMLAVRGHPAKYDEWRAMPGCAGWGYDDVLPYFRRLESTQLGDDAVRGRTGPVTITEATVDPLGAAFVDSCVSAGHGRARDYNGSGPDGAAPAQFNIRRGERRSVAASYLHPVIGRANLSVASRALTERVLFDNRRAVGVQYRIDNVSKVARARTGVIVCAGALRSPQILELSGIGEPALLGELGIPVVHPLPGVGRNLQDHLFGRLRFECNARITINDLLRSRFMEMRELASYAIRRTGMLSNPSYTSIAFLRSEPHLSQPDIRVQLAIVSGARRLSKNLKDGLDPHSGFIIGGYPMYPKSRGEVHIRSTDANVAPKVVANYLTAPEDAERAVKVLRLLRRIADQPALRRFIVREVAPGPDVESDADLLDYFRRNGETSWHLAGSCRMGAGADAVVDNRLRVHGVEHLYVADASVFPIMVSSNTHLPTIMLGERAAELIAEAHDEHRDPVAAEST